mmetsp:Transcript_18255/g.42032  ORF Transcript_18255/g.42032 Transcript_18255/m.42032 type:complete len:106 (-) Transcript_18255:2-319(-)
MTPNPVTTTRISSASSLSVLRAAKCVANDDLANAVDGEKAHNKSTFKDAWQLRKNAVEIFILARKVSSDSIHRCFDSLFVTVVPKSRNRFISIVAAYDELNCMKV